MKTTHHSYANRMQIWVFSCQSSLYVRRLYFLECAFTAVTQVRFHGVFGSVERPWNETLSAKIAEVQESFKNIPSMLYFSPSSVSVDGIGIYSAEPLPKGTS